ncbi:MAG: hypothetical protein AAF492_27565, partial [Verrucomicrobiota bacterium]
QRRPDAVNEAVNPVMNILMNNDRSARALYIPQSRDLDNDMMEDWWEFFYFGDTIANPMADDDGDGQNNLSEHEAGTNPRDAESVLNISSIVIQPDGTVTIQWPSVENRTYTLWKSLNLFTGFAVCESNIMATPPLNTVNQLLIPGVERLYFRIEVQSAD